MSDESCVVGLVRFGAVDYTPYRPQTGRVPSRHYRDAKVFGLWTTAMRDNEYTPRPHAPGLTHFLYAFGRFDIGNICVL